MSQLGDYRAGRLGPVQQLPNPLLWYLRTADAEAEAVKRHWDAELAGE